MHIHWLWYERGPNKGSQTTIVIATEAADPRGGGYCTKYSDEQAIELSKSTWTHVGGLRFEALHVLPKLIRTDLKVIHTVVSSPLMRSMCYVLPHSNPLPSINWPLTSQGTVLLNVPKPDISLAWRFPDSKYLPNFNYFILSDGLMQGSYFSRRSRTTRICFRVQALCTGFITPRVSIAIISAPAHSVINLNIVIIIIMKDLPAPCAACKLLRRRCVRDCIYAPYFPAEDPLKFASVHKIFGASNINKMLKELPEHQRNDAVSSMVYEANARVRDPVYGCVGAISCLQKELVRLRAELVEVNKEIIRLRSENVYEEGAEICCYGDLQNWSPDSPGVDMDLFAGPSGLNSDSSSNVFEQCFG